VERHGWVTAEDEPEGLGEAGGAEDPLAEEDVRVVLPLDLVDVELLRR
jgi:hypothetical protein